MQITILSTKEKKFMQFRKVTFHKYIGENGFSLIQASDGSYAIYKDSVRTSWGSYFVSVKGAEYVMNTHVFAKATIDSLPMNDSDICDIINMYCGDVAQEEDDYLEDRYTLTDRYSLAENMNGPTLELYKDGQLVESFSDAESCIKILDRIVNHNLFSSVTFRGTELRSILAAKLPPSNEKRSARDAAKNLVRVKSSNVWAYGVEIKDRKAKEGDVYVQFKGKNGGPESLYVYYSVPLTVWRKVLSAPSKGHAIWQYLRNNFLYSKLTGNKRGVLPNAVNN